MLNKDDFLEVVNLTPLVSIDLVVSNADNAILMGKRVNEPAAGYWFVPGGRIFKGESLEQAFQRITATELGMTLTIDKGQLIGAFTHLYDTNFAHAPGISTHYVVLAYRLHLTIDPLSLPPQQHQEYQLFKQSDDLSAVHPNNLPYFS
ncbi:GDP-mannose mannosyl hydrolase [Methylomonas sp. AM2-LC]|uniref:GDP-mannose mannosyl hydrolase n=1 Tax=Methylomonas sp. AM2-LC TaxID=3153301 RepID=UPI0032641E05